MLPIIDTHQHLWDLEKFNLPWAAGIPQLNHSFVTSDYLEAAKTSEVVKTVYMEVDVEPAQRVAEVEYITNLCQQDDNPTAAAVIAGSPDAADFQDYMAQFKDNTYVKGIRQVLHTPESQPGRCVEPGFIAGIKHLGELGLIFDICIRPGELSDAVKLVDACPGTQFVLDHCGNADPGVVSGEIDANTLDKENPFWHDPQQWKDNIAALGERDNVVCKISGIVARAAEGWNAKTLAPTVNHCLDSFGPDRVIFGGDWPVCTLVAPLGQWVSALRAIIISRSEAEQRKLLYDNAARIYGLE